jgi:hypothetical protein
MKSTPLFNISLYLLNNKEEKRFTGKRSVISRCSIRTQNKMPTTVQKQQGGTASKKISQLSRLSELAADRYTSGCRNQAFKTAGCIEAVPRRKGAINSYPSKMKPVVRAAPGTSLRRTERGTRPAGSLNSHTP